ncbi:hypothetical protein BJY01DRAFT_221068 [Aspergillus pseudoustus]|uniref:Uncharacterized protein n=1 Tax=Aspergillus pseudoustus TaxID=1810923 RepID=A0ABR4JCQ5_9EURO
MATLGCAARRPRKYRQVAERTRCQFWPRPRRENGGVISSGTAASILNSCATVRLAPYLNEMIQDASAYGHREVVKVLRDFAREAKGRDDRE